MTVSLLLVIDLQSGQRTANAGFGKRADSVSAHELYLSAIKIEEIELGVLRAERRSRIDPAFMARPACLPAFQDRILPVEPTVARLQVPDPFPFRDSLVAATALVHCMLLVTRNTSDFERSGVDLLNPWM